MALRPCVMMATASSSNIRLASPTKDGAGQKAASLKLQRDGFAGGQL